MAVKFPDPTPRLEEIYSRVEHVVVAFCAAGRRLYLVGGSVRDAVLGRHAATAPLPEGDVQPQQPDFDFTTDALPEEVERIVSPHAEAMWLVGKRYGTVSARVAGVTLEITTHRGDTYREESRKPEVIMGTSLQEDLVRRDFRINAMAVEFTSGRPFAIIDPFSGMSDLAESMIRTPGAPEASFSDDPLRMMRAARFAAQLGFGIDPAVLEAMAAMATRLEIVSRERIRDELDKIMLAPQPSRGLRVLVDTGLAAQFLPELPALALEQDPIHRHKDVLEHTYSVVDKTSPNLELRLAALFHDVGKPATRRYDPSGVSFHNHDVVGAKMTKKRMRELRYSTSTVNTVARLVYLHLRFHTYQAGWTDKAVRRYVVEAGPLLDPLNELTLADCTTRNQKKVRILEDRMTELKERIVELREREEFEAIRPELDGTEVMEILGLSPSPEVGVAMKFLLQLRLDEGPIGHDEVKHRLLEFWAEHKAASSSEAPSEPAGS